LVNFGPLTKKL